MRLPISLCLAIVMGLPASAFAHNGPHVVTVRNNDFSPQRMEVDPGESVTWFAEDNGHTVTADDGSFDVVLQAGATIQRAFPTEGIFGYYCRVHGNPGSGMWGRIVVGITASILDASVAEGDVGVVDANIPVTLNRVAAHPVQLSYATQDATAIAGVDYHSVAGSLTIPAGSTSATIQVPIIGDTDREPTKEFRLLLSDPIGAGLERATATIRIENDDDTVRRTPSDDYPTLETAMSGIRPDTEIAIGDSLPPLTAPVTIDVPRISITGDPATSILQPVGRVDAGLVVRADGVRISGLLVRNFDRVGIEVLGARDFRVADSRLETNLSYGLRLDDARNVRVDRVHVLRGDRAGIAIHACTFCDTQIRDATVELAWAGIEVRAGASIVVRDSLLRRNANGIVVRATETIARATVTPRLQGAAHLFKNRIEESGYPSASGPRTVSERIERDQLVRGTGVWLDGAWSAVIERNTLTANRVGIAVTGSTQLVHRVRVLDNDLQSTTVYDLGWDGLGTGVCFEGNAADANSLRTEPPNAEAVYACGSDLSPGIPWPPAAAHLVAT